MGELGAGMQKGSRMAFLRSSSLFEPGLVVRGAGVRLRLPVMGDFADWAELRALSRQHLRPYEPQWAADELTLSAYRRRMRHYQGELRNQTGCAFFLFTEPAETLVGGVTLSNIRRGVAQAASVGYWLGRPYVRRGLMSAALAAIKPFCFEELRLHRLEAACLPTNRASLATLAKAGFREEGLARGYLRIDGRWQDHVLLALLAEDWDAERMRQP